MYLVINKCVTAVKVSNFSGHYLRNRSTLDIGVLGNIGIVQHKEHSPEVVTLTRGTHCIYIYIYIYIYNVTTALVGQCLLIVDSSLSHSDTSLSVGFLCTSGQPVAQTST